MIIDEQQLQIPINEVYFGKSPELLNMEKQLGIFRKKWIGKYISSFNSNSDPDLIKLNRMFEDFFGFGCFMLNIINSRTINAYTAPISYRYDFKFGKKYVEITKTGYRFKKDLDLSCVVNIYAGLIFNPEVTDEEVMSIILHEIGHNFSVSITNTQAPLTMIFNTIRLVLNCSTFIGYFLTYFNTIEFRSAYDKFVQKLKTDNSIILAIPKTLETIKAVISFGFNTIDDILNVLTLGLIGNVTVLNRLIQAPTKIFDYIIGLLFFRNKYRDEKISDNFATMYGYGPALISMQKKFSFDAMDSTSLMNEVNKIPILSTIIHMNSLPAMILLTAFDEHPNGIIRARDQLNLLKHEIAKQDIDPKMRKSLNQDIIACEKELNKFLKIKNNDPYLAKKIYYKLLTDVFNDKELKDLLGEFNPEKRYNDYDNRYDKLV